jgi:hypothetical protein
VQNKFINYNTKQSIMKNVFLFIALAATGLTSFAQSEKYTKAMQDKVGAVDSTRNPDALKDLSAAFERIADAEKTQWLPYYYAALTQVNAGYMSSMNAAPDASVVDPLADKAESLLNKAEALSKDNSEIFVVKKMIATLRMFADPMTRYMTYGQAAQQALEKAKKLNAENPRVYLLEGQDKFYTPEQFGGSKEKAKELFEEALKKYETFKPASDIDPNWGKTTLQYFIAQVNK